MPSCLARLPITTESTGHLVGEQAQILLRIPEPDVNLSLWRRMPAAAVEHEIAGLRATDLPDVRCRTSPTTFDQDIGALLRDRGLDPEAFTRWRADLRELADHFFGVSADRAVIARLETTDEDGCPRFHADRTHLRLLCTYRGPGTEWLTNEQVDRDAQGNREPNERILRFGAPSRFKPFWVGILKGEAYPGNAGRGLVHRSPPIADSGQTRVLFCLDC